MMLQEIRKIRRAISVEGHGGKLKLYTPFNLNGMYIKIKGCALDG